MAAKDPRFPQVGGTLGLLARRVGNFVSEVSESVTTPEMLREHLAQVRAARRGEGPREALALAQRDADDLSVHPQTLAATAMASVQIVVLEYLAELDHEAPSMAVSSVNDSVEAARRQLEVSGQQNQAPLAQLAKALQRLIANDAEACHDELRRLPSELKGVAHADRPETHMYRHLVAALAHLQLQHRRRGLRELSKCRSYLDPSWPCPELRARIAKIGVDGHLAAGDTAAARRWLTDLYELKIGDHGPPPVESIDEVTWVNRLLLDLRIATVSGDLKESRAIARELLGTLKHETWRRWTSLHLARACLSLGDDWLTRGIPGESGVGSSASWRSALEAIEQLPGSGSESAGASVRRLLALRNHQKSSQTGDTAGQTQAINDLTGLAMVQSGAERSESLWELCHLCLAAEQHDAEVMRMVTDELERNPECHHAELQLFAAVHDPSAETDDHYRYHLALDTVAKATRSRPDAPGLDELSPLRDELRRTQVLCSQAALLRARRALADGDLARAEIEIVEALTHDPEIASGHALLSEIVQDATEARIEDLLDRALELMRGAPSQLAGRDFNVFAEIIPKLRAERERLIRPLTIAVMGEFSSGKSTFVNALVGREVAPMGVLPTTSTINRFRNGRAGARAHRRDGWISLLADDDVKPYLDGLDETSAADLRFIDIDVDCPSLGDMVIVDTPGLNALDGFHESVAREFLNESDAIVWVFSATRAGAGSEAEFLRELDQEDRKILGVLNKVDTLDAEERRELSDFLNERLGSALVDIVDVSAKRALDHAVSETGRYHDDPMFNVRQALDRQFRERSPQLKLELSVRRSRLALQATIDALRDEADQLEAVANQADADRADALNLPQLLKELGDELNAKLLDLSDHLTREALALGLVESGSGLKASALEDAGISDLSYLEQSFTEAALDRVAAIRRQIAERGQAAEVLADVFDRHFATWTRGFAAALGASKVANTLLFEYGQRSRDGERSFRDALRQALEPVAEQWRDELIALTPLVEAQVLRHQRAQSHAPKAESLRLRQIWIPKLQALSRGMINIAENLES